MIVVCVFWGRTMPKQKYCFTNEATDSIGLLQNEGRNLVQTDMSTWATGSHLGQAKDLSCIVASLTGAIPSPN